MMQALPTRPLQGAGLTFTNWFVGTNNVRIQIGHYVYNYAYIAGVAPAAYLVPTPRPNAEVVVGLEIGDCVVLRDEIFQITNGPRLSYVTHEDIDRIAQVGSRE